MMRIKPETVFSELDKLFPNAKAELVFHNDFECLICVVLSAQTTDVSVNRVTPALFAKYPDAFALAKANQEEVEGFIRSIGLYKNKAKNIIALSKALVERYDGKLPRSKEELVTLPGVGNKTAAVVGGECLGIPSVAVDTHVSRVAKRLGYARENDEPTEIEAKLEKDFPKEVQVRLHHRMIFFGRRICHARNPECDKCPFTQGCLYFKKTSSKTGK